MLLGWLHCRLPPGGWPRYRGGDLVSVAIRRKPLNAPDCPLPYDACKDPTNNFSVQVLKNNNAEAKPVYVHIYGLPEGEELLIEREYISGCDPMWSPLRCGGNALALDVENPDIMLVVPGTYRFRTASSTYLDEWDFAVEISDVHVEYADLWLKQQSLCCCRGKS